MKRIILVLILSFSTFYSFGNHVTGGELTYKNTKDSIYEITFKCYRDCNSNSLNITTSGSVNLVCQSTGKTDTLSMSLISIKEITSLCKSDTGYCGAPNSKFNGRGFEEHVYTTTIDFSKSPYNQYITCGNLYIEATMYARTNNSQSSGAGKTQYLFTPINTQLLGKNSSPTFKYKPRFKHFCNSPMYMQFQAEDSDGDSLSYSLETPLIAYGSKTTYPGSLSQNKPLEVYTINPPSYVNPRTSLPIGFSLNDRTGLISCTPTACSKYNLIVVKVTEWRKDNNGRYQRIGEMRREVQVEIMIRSDNSPPFFNNRWTYDVCVGDTFEIQFVAYDIIYKSDPKLNPPPDTTSVSWDSAIQGATFYQKEDTSRIKTGVFKWAPKESDVTTTPWIFNVYADDNHCPFPGRDVHEVYVTVYPQPKFEIVKDQINCTEIDLYSKYDKKKLTDLNVAWVLKDLNDSVLDNSVAYFDSSKNAYGHNDEKIRIKNEGSIVIEGKGYVNKQCSFFQRDTIYTSGEVDLLPLRDTAICLSTSASFKLDTVVEKNLASWKWSYQSDSSSNTEFISQVEAGKNALLLSGIGKDGCYRKDTMFIQAMYKPQSEPLVDSIHCTGNERVLMVKDYLDSGFVNTNVKWSDGKTTTSTSVSSTSTISVTLSNECGDWHDSCKTIIDTFYMFSLGTDKLLCDSTSTQIGVQKVKQGANILWSTGDTTSQISVSTDGQYYLTANNVCGAFTDTIEVLFDRTPQELNWPENVLYCDSVNDVYDALNSGFTYMWNDGSTQQKNQITSPGGHSVIVSSKHCGSIKDSTYAVLVLTPSPNLGNDTSLLKPFTIELGAGEHGISTYKWGHGPTTQKVLVTDFGLYTVEVTNVCGSRADSIDISNKLSIWDETSSNILVFPNPVRKDFEIRNVNAQVLTIGLTDNSGKVIPLVWNLVGNEYQVKLSESLTSGTYVVTIQTDKSTIQKSILIVQ